MAGEIVYVMCNGIGWDTLLAPQEAVRTVHLRDMYSLDGALMTLKEFKKF
jgi:hypothetical protein